MSGVPIPGATGTQQNAKTPGEWSEIKKVEVVQVGDKDAMVAALKKVTSPDTPDKFYFSIYEHFIKNGEAFPKQRVNEYYGRKKYAISIMIDATRIDYIDAWIKMFMAIKAEAEVIKSGLPSATKTQSGDPLEEEFGDESNTEDPF
jgi:hypothetical protein